MKIIEIKGAKNAETVAGYCISLEAVFTYRPFGHDKHQFLFQHDDRDAARVMNMIKQTKLYLEVSATVGI